MSKTLAKQNSTDLPNISFESLLELARKKLNPDQVQEKQSAFYSDSLLFWIGFYAWIPLIIKYPIKSLILEAALFCLCIFMLFVLNNVQFIRLCYFVTPHVSIFFLGISTSESDKAGWKEIWRHLLSPLGLVLWVRKKMKQLSSMNQLKNESKSSSHMSVEVLKLLPSVFDEVCKDEENRIMCALRGNGGLKDKLNAQIQKSLEQRAYWGMRYEQEQGKNPQVTKTLDQTLEIFQRLSAHRERLEKVEAQITTMFAQFRARFAGVQTHVQDTLQLQDLAQLEAEVDETQSQIEEMICGIVTEVAESMMRLRDQLNECLAQSTVNVAGSLPSTGNANQDLAYIDHTINSLVGLKLDQVEPEIG